MCEDWTRHPLPEEKYEEELERNNLFECEECGRVLPQKDEHEDTGLCWNCFFEVPTYEDEVNGWAWEG